jgi:hypothetical protein
VEKNGLRLIVAMVPDGNFHGPALFGRLMEKPVSFLSADLLQRTSVPFLKRTDIHRFANAGDPHVGAETADKRLLPIRFGFPETVIKVNRRQTQLEFVCQERKDVEKSHGIGTTGNGHDEMISSLQHGVDINRFPDLIQHSGTNASTKHGWRLIRVGGIAYRTGKISGPMTPRGQPFFSSAPATWRTVWR